MLGPFHNIKDEAVREALLADGWRRNTGRCPEDLQEDGKKIDVIMRSGYQSVSKWVAWGRGGCRWSFEKYGFDIAFFREAK